MVSLKNFKKANYESVEKVSFSFADKLRVNGMDSGSITCSIIATAYLAYLVADKDISTDEEIKLLIDNLPEARKYFIKEFAWKHLNIITDLNRDFTKEELLMLVLFSSREREGKKGAEYETPGSIAKLACKILDIDGKRVADFCCGDGTFLLEASNYDTASLWGIERETYSKEIAAIRMELVSEDSTIVQGNTFNIDKEKKFDCIFSEFPFNVRVRDSHIDSNLMKELEITIQGTQKSPVMDWMNVANVVKHLDKNGKAVVVVPNGLTWNGGYHKDIRKNIIKSGVLSAVISLPGGLYNSTNIPVSLFVFEKDNPATSIRMINAMNMANIGRRKSILLDETIAEITRLLNEDSEDSIVASYEELEKKEFSINPINYLESEIEIKDGVELETIVKNITRGSQMNAKSLDELSSDVPTDIQYLMLANIQDGLINEDLPYLKELDKKLEKYCIKDKNLIISKNGAPFKVAVATVEDGKTLLANGNLYVIELDQDKVNPFFLKAFLESNDGTVLLNRLSVGSSIPSIPISSLLKLIVPLPTMEEQNRIADLYLAKVDEVRILKNRLVKATAELKTIYKEG